MTGGWGGEGLQYVEEAVRQALPEAHVRSTGDLGSWKGDICFTSYKATSATLIVPPTPSLQKLSACAAAGSSI